MRQRHSLGASLVSASSSIFLQAIPFVYGIAIIASEASRQTIEMVLSSFLIGQLATTMAAPYLISSMISRNFLLLGFFLTYAVFGLVGATYLPLAGAVFGAFSGIVQYVSVIFAARTDAPNRSFSIRVAVTMTVSASLLLAAPVLSTKPLIVSFVFLLSLQVAVFLVGLAFLPRRTRAIQIPSSTKKNGWSVGAVLTIYFGMAVSSLTLAPIVDLAGVSIADAMFALGAARLSSGIFLIILSAQISSHNSFVVVSTCITGLLLSLLVTAVESYFTIFVCFFCLEFFGNALSARLLSVLSQRFGDMLTKWLATFIQLGIALSHLMIFFVPAQFLWALFVINVVSMSALGLFLFGFALGRIR